MSFERLSPGSERAADRFGTEGEDADSRTSGLPPALRLQILATEHWSLLATRSLAWNEIFSRAGMFLTTLSAAMVALALVAQASAFGQPFFIFALVILPIVLFVGVTTFLRLGASNYHDALCVAGMNRIRGAYLELAPDLEPYFITSGHDDVRGVALTMGAGAEGGTFTHFLAGTPNLIIVLNSLLVGVIASLLALQLVSAMVMPLVAGAAGFLLTLAVHVWYARHTFRHAQASLRPLFPTPEGELRPPRQKE